MRACPAYLHKQEGARHRCRGLTWCENKAVSAAKKKRAHVSRAASGRADGQDVAHGADYSHPRVSMSSGLTAPLVSHNGRSMDAQWTLNGRYNGRSMDA